MGRYGEQSLQQVGEIVGEATTKGKEWPANAQALSRRKNSLASTLRPFGIEITRGKRGGGSRHIKISARPESARIIAPNAPNAPNAAAAAENAMIDCATTRPIAPGASEGGGGRGRNGRNSTASFWETHEGTSPPSLLATRPASIHGQGWGRVSVCVRAVWPGGLSSSTCWCTTCRSRATNSSTRRSMTKKVGGEGRAMVITNGIERTIRYIHVIRN